MHHWKATFQLFGRTLFENFKHFSKTLCPRPFSTKSFLNLFLKLPLQFIVVCNKCNRLYNKFTAAYIIVMLPFNILASFACKFQTLFELTVLVCFPVNTPWTYSRKFIFRLLLLVIIVIGSIIFFSVQDHLKATFRVFSLFRLQNIELTVIICFTLNFPWTSSWQFLRGWFCKGIS